MPQNTNLNVTPYNDDFDENKNYHRVLFKPGTAIQARELTTLQTILQNQIERFGTYMFKEGAKVIPGQTGYDANYECVQIDPTFFGVSVSSYIDNLIGVTIVGETSGVSATVVKVLSDTESDRGNNTLYIRYVASSSTDFQSDKFISGERLITQSDIEYGISVIRSGNPFATCISDAATATASAAFIQEGIYFIRGYFVKVQSETILLDQYSNKPSYRIGLLVSEDIVTSFDDDTLNDNAQGFSNFAAPGADRFQISTALIKKSLDDFNDEDFIELMRVDNGLLSSYTKNTELNYIKDEFARRTYDESGDYYVKPFEVFVKESLNDRIANGGVYLETQKTAQGNTPSENLLTLQVSPGKAYVRGYEIEKQTSTFLDVDKPNTSNDVPTFSLPYTIGNRVVLNNVTGSPVVGFGTTATLSLRNSRVGSSGLVAAGTEIGKARCYDFKLKDSAYEDDTTEFEGFLYDINTYTSVTIGSTVSIATPALIEGNSSGSKGYLTQSVTGSQVLTLESVSGSFIVGESISVNGISSSPTISTITDYSFFDVKSLFSTVGVSSFSADLDLSDVFNLSDQTLTISASSGGISTITGPVTTKFAEGLNVGDIVSYTRTGFSTVTYNKVSSIGTGLNSVEVSAVTTVSDICDGDLPSSQLTLNDLQLRLPDLIDSDKASFFQPMPHANISNINLDNTQLVYRKTYAANVSSNGCVVIENDPDSTFEPFDEERYVLTYSNGTIEPLSEGKLSFSQDSKTLTLSQLSTATDANARLTATLRKFKVNSKSKVLNRCATLTLTRSNNSASGSTVNTSLNDGLTYSTVYGTRVQDKEISLNKAEVLRIHAIYESDDNTAPTLPKLTVFNVVGDLTQVSSGDEFVGETSGAVARVVSTTATTVTFVYQNEREYQLNERFTCKLSQVSATISAITLGDKKINDNYVLDSGERLEFLDYGRLIRKESAPAPSRQVTIVFDYYSTPSSDDGEFFSYLSWPANVVSNGTDLPRINDRNLRNSDTIDLRPRVSDYDTSSSRSPFEYSSRIFPNNGSSVTTNLVGGEALVLGYSYKLGRIDKLVLDRDGDFEVVHGEPSESPVPPIIPTDSFEVATISLPPYSTHARTDNLVSLTKHKRYQMRDISNLESRIKNVEYFTALSLLEQETENLSIKDPVTGLDRFKNGFYVDNFRSHDPHNVSSPDFKSSINVDKGELRPSHYTTSLDLLLGSASAIGIGTTANAAVDLKYVTDLQNANIQRTGDLITLKYDETTFVQQNFATRYENINPFSLVNWIGNIELYPESDTWIEEKMFDPIKVDQKGDYDAWISVYQSDPNTGFSPIDWEIWKTVWAGKTVVSDEYVEKAKTPSSNKTVGSFVNNGGPHRRKYRQTTFRDTYQDSYLSEYKVSTKQSKQAIQYNVTPKVDSVYLGEKLVSRDIVPYCRERNIEFSARRVKPSTQFYAFFENVNMTEYCVPKLLEIQMDNGVFVVGETIRSLESTTNSSKESEQFVARAAVPDHKYGPYNAPTIIFNSNPYDSTVGLSSQYSATSTVLNIDTSSLSDMANPIFKGRVKVGMKLKGETSGAEATITNLRLISDSSATLIGSLYIPNPKFATNPQFATGSKTFRLSSSPINSTVPGSVSSAGEAKFVSSGLLDIKQSTYLSTRNGQIETITLSDSRTIDSEFGYTKKVRDNQNVQKDWIDPLAETFVVAKGDDCFITSIDVYFQSKDSTIPVTLQVRTTSSDLPTTEIVPFGEVTLEPSQVNTSTDGTSATKFRFNSPIHLTGGQSYALVLTSPSNNYNVWIARMGEVDVTTANLSQNQQIVVSQQPYLGSLFKPQNGSTWDPSQSEDLKFVIHRASFTSSTGTFTAYNPRLSAGNDNIVTLKPNPIYSASREVVVGLGSTVPSTFLTPGVTITQINNPNATGKLVKTAGIIGVGRSTNNILNLTVNNVGSGLTPSSGTFLYSNVNLNSVTGGGSGAVALVQVVNGSIGIVTVTNGGTGYSVGDVLSAQVGATSKNVRFNVGVVTSVNQLSLTGVQGNFDTVNTIAYNNVGVASTLPAVPTTINISTQSDGSHIVVSHRNHGMHAASNKVTLSNIDSDYTPVTLNAEYSSTSIADIQLSSITIFNTFENVGVSSTNPGYVIVNDEIISYEGTSGNNLTGVTRGIDNTLVKTHPVGSYVNKYEFNGVSLRRINKTHDLSSATVTDPRSLDTYALKVDFASNGVDRTVGNANGFQPLHFNSSKVGGGFVAKATQNIQFEAITPNVSTLKPAGTNITTRVRTVSGTSISGNEVSFEDMGFEQISLNETNYFTSPRIICSQINETNRLTNLPGNKSFTMEFNMNTETDRLSPVIDLQRLNIITTSNRIDNIVSDFASDKRVNSPIGDPNAAVYVSKKVSLSTPARSLQVRFSGFRYSSNEIRVLYRLFRQDLSDSDQPYQLFPGYTNLTKSGVNDGTEYTVIDPALNNGLPNDNVPSSTPGDGDGEFYEYLYSQDNLPAFNGFMIKIVMTGTNQAFVPKISDLRVIALAS